METSVANNQLINNQKRGVLVTYHYDCIAVVIYDYSKLPAMENGYYIEELCVWIHLKLCSITAPEKLGSLYIHGFS